MLITAIELPSPRVIKKKINKYMTKERVCIYTSVGLGICVVFISGSPVKILPISSLIYCTFAYEVIENSDKIINDPEVLKLIFSNPAFSDKLGSFNW